MSDWAHSLAVKIGLKFGLGYQRALALEADLTPAIAAIEAEAVTAALDALAAQVRAMPRWDKRTVPGGFHVKQSDVLNAIERAKAYREDTEHE